MERAVAGAIGDATRAWAAIDTATAAFFDGDDPAGAAGVHGNAEIKAAKRLQLKLATCAKTINAIAAPTFELHLTADELQRRCDLWLSKVYETRPHRGLDGMTPRLRAASWTGEVRAIADVRALDALLAPAAGNGTRVVSRKGLQVGGRCYIAPELGPRVGERVGVREDAAEPARLHVFAANGWFICLAGDPARTGLAVRRVAREAAVLAGEADRRARRRARDLQRRDRPETAMDDVLASAADGDRVAAFPPPATGMMRESGSVRLSWSFARGPGSGGVGGRPPGLRPVRAAFSSRARIFSSYSSCSRAWRSAARVSSSALAATITARRSSRRDSSSSTLIPSGTFAASAASPSAISSATSARSRASISRARFHDSALCRLASAWIFVPSSATVPSFNMPALARQQQNIHEQLLDLGAPRRRVSLVEEGPTQTVVGLVW